MKRSIANLVSPEVAEIIGTSKTAVIPFGSVEQHGPHLPCGTDTMAAEVISERLAYQLGALYVPFGRTASPRFMLVIPAPSTCADPLLRPC